MASEYGSSAYVTASIVKVDVLATLLRQRQEAGLGMKVHGSIGVEWAARGSATWTPARGVVICYH